MMPFPLRVFLTAMIGGCILIAVILLAAPAWAQTNPNCSPKATALNSVKRMWGEEPVFVGPSSDGNSVIVTVGAKGSWSIFSCASNVCCLMAGGQTAQFLRGA